MGKFLLARPLETISGWVIKNITTAFDTPPDRKLQKLRPKRPSKKKDNLLFIEVSFLWSQERERIFSRVLSIDSTKGEFVKRAGISQLDPLLYEKINSIFQEKHLGIIDRYNSFLAYNPKGDKTVVVLSKEKDPPSLEYFLIEGLALRSIQLEEIVRLVRVNTYIPGSAYLEEKVLEKNDYCRVVGVLIDNLATSLVCTEKPLTRL